MSFRPEAWLPRPPRRRNTAVKDKGLGQRPCGQTGKVTGMPGIPGRDWAAKKNIIEDGTPPPNALGSQLLSAGGSPPAPDACRRGRVLLPAVQVKGGLPTA